MGEVIVQVLVGLLITAVGILLSALLRRAVGHLEALAGVKLDADEREEIDRALKLAIGFAEEAANRALKAGREPLESEAKMRAAVGHFNEHGFDIEPEEVEPLLAAKLGEMRLHGRTASNEE